MKKLQYILLALAFVLAGCNNKDSIWNVMDDMDSRIVTLETLCQEMNTNISALETLIKAQNNGDYITNITEIRNGSTIVGYTITFKNHEPITIYNGTNGKDGHDGADGYKPTVGAKQDTDGIYYWTVDGEWLTDANGNKIPVTGEKGDKGDKGDTGDKGQDGQDGHDGINGVNGNTPQLKIDGGYWYISYDGGTNWIQLGKATGEDGKDGTNGTNGSDGAKGDKGEKGDKGDAGDTMFQSVTQDDNYVYFTLADGTIIQIAKNGNSGSTGDQPNSEFLFEVTFDANGGVGTMPKDTFYYGIAKTLDICDFAFEREGYVFAGWNTQKDGSGVSYKYEMPLIINKNMTLYAQWIVFGKLLPEAFSISPTQKVRFASGNLQYRASNNIWRLAEHQYDYVGVKNSYISDSYDGWIDLFCWGTGDTPTATDVYSSTFVEWGKNKIEENAPNIWRTLTKEESYYLFHTRPNATELFAFGHINDILGIIILPDDWINPCGITFTTSVEQGCKDYGGYYIFSNSHGNIYTLSEWQILEKSGAVFLPDANIRTKQYVSSSDGFGYWLSTVDNDESNIRPGAYCIHQSLSHFGANDVLARNAGLSVRLVQDAK